MIGENDHFAAALGVEAVKAVALKIPDGPSSPLSAKAWSSQSAPVTALFPDLPNRERRQQHRGDDNGGEPRARERQQSCVDSRGETARLSYGYCSARPS